MIEQEPPPGDSGGRLRVVVALAVVLALGAFVAWWLKPPVSPGTALPPRASAPAAPVPSAAPAPAPSETPETKPARRAPKAAPAPESPPETATPAAPAATTLRVTSDVDGAFVFVDRQFAGRTPFATTSVAPGSHEVRVSAEGYDGVSQHVDLAEGASSDVNLSLKTVRLHAAVSVVHKHAMGSCEGRLTADPKGLHYETTNREDAFTIAFPDLETFSLDYQQKLLRVKKRNGRTWNFTTRAENADSMLVFQRDVDKARVRLAH